MIALMMIAAATNVDPACYDGGDDLEMALCWKDAGERADQELSAFWPNILGAAREADRRFAPTQRKDRPSAEIDLLAAQKIWMGWRDSECSARADWAQGGSLENVTFGQYYFELTHQRIADLKNLLGFFRDN